MINAKRRILDRCLVVEEEDHGSINLTKFYEWSRKIWRVSQGLKIKDMGGNKVLVELEKLQEMRWVLKMVLNAFIGIVLY